MDRKELETKRAHYAGLLDQFKRHSTDVASPEYHVIRLTYFIERLASHAKEHKKDHPVHRRLVSLVSERKKWQKNLINKKYTKYEQLIKSLGLRK